MAHSILPRHALRITALLLGPLLLASGLTLTTAVTPAYAADNKIVAENRLPGNPASEWDVTGAGDLTLQGFATQMSVAPGETVAFKVDDTTVTQPAAAGYRIDIYRLGYYGGAGARLVGTILPGAITQPVQPDCTFTDTAGERLLDCGNWAVTASWQVPALAVSGIYIARPTRTDDGTKASHITFVVRDDTGSSDILVQTSDTTWQAYNPYGGYNAYYTANGEAGNAWKLSYNRPFTTRGSEPENWLFNSEYPMLSWLERNGYDVSYTTHIDVGLHPERLLTHKVFLSSGHDEYWSHAQRDAVEDARDQGVNLAFFSGNEVYWRIRYEDSVGGSSGDQRTMVVYKEGSLAPSTESEHRRCYMNFSCDPSSEWTGLWRESTTDGATSSIGEPENALSGQISWRNNTSDITVPSDYASLRFWRNTAVAALTSGQTATLGSGTLGYEWSPQYEQYMSSYPAGRVLLSSTNAISTFAGVDQHHLSLYRATPNGALVFGAGTVQWAWGLDSHHDRAGTQASSAPDPRMQQATVNLLADMGVQPTTLQGDLVASVKSTDVTAPTVTITSPGTGASVPAGPVTVTGTASDTGGAVGVVEVSTDGTVWRPATGLQTWSFSFIAAQGTTTIHVRAADDSANLGAAVTRSVTVTPRVCDQSSPCSVFTGQPNYVQDPDNRSTEVGVKFRSSTAGYITGVRFYKAAGNTGTHTGSLWSADGTNLSSAVFTGESSTGWQEVTFGAPIPVAANTTYVASYHAPNGHYSVGQAFTYASVDNPPLSALKADETGTDGPNGLYKLSSTPTFPTDAYGSSNYLVDVLFATTVGADTTPPTVVSTVPVANAAAIQPTANVTATFGEAMAPGSFTASTVILRDALAAVVPATVIYSAATRSLTIDPAATLLNHTTYTATIVGGVSGVTDLAGNPLASDHVWSFTTAVAQAPRPDPNTGPGGPVLVVTGTGLYGSYLKEILRAEGLNLFTAATTSTLTTPGLAPYTTVVLGETTLTTAQVTALTSWVTAGGNLVAVHPDAQLATLLGLSAPAGTLAEGYIKVDTSAAPGQGIVSATMQFHGTADLYTAQAGTQVVAELYSNASTATGRPAVTLRSVGGAGGSAAAFLYDLAGSVVKTRQGNPAWINQDRDGQAPYRSDDLFFGAMAGDLQPDYVDPTKIDIPAADEQQRLLANVMTATTRDALPLPRFWYLPRGEQAAIVMTADNHDTGSSASVASRLNQEIAASPAGCAVDDWACIRSTVYLYPANAMTNAQAKAFEDQGFEIALHAETGCQSPTAEQYAEQLTTQLSAVTSSYPSLQPSATTRNHCISWSDYTTMPGQQVLVGINLDTNYYYWPGGWVADKPGMFTGSGFAQRFSTSGGQLIDVYQATTQMTDESDQTYPGTAIALMDAAITKGYYGTFVANIHSDGSSEAVNAQIVAAAKARGVPVISAKQLLTWTDGRNASSFTNVVMSGNTLTFSITKGAGANGLEAMLPVLGDSGTLHSLTLNGAPVTTETRTIKGEAYKVFTAGTGSYTATYGADTTGPVISNRNAVANGNGTVTVTWTTDEPSTSRVDYGTAANQLTSSRADGTLTTTHSVTIPGVAQTIYYRVTSADILANATTSPALANDPASITLPPPLTTDDTVSDFTAGTTGAGTYVSNTSGGEVILAPTVGTEFEGTSLPSGWTSTKWDPSAAGSIVSGGQASVDGSLLRTDATYTSGRSLEFVATFTGTSNEHAGFAADFGTGPWAIFSTSSGGSLWARVTNGGVNLPNVDLGSSYLGASHRFRIDWLADSVVFSVDGTVLATTSATITGAMSPAISDLNPGGTALAVDWMRMTPYALSGSFLSRVHDAGARADWGTFTWTGTTPTGTGMTLSARTGNTAVPDGTWTAFTAIQNGADVTTQGRYLQYRMEAVSTDTAVTPVLASVTFDHTVLADQTAPAITSRTPAPGATNQALGTSVTIGFSESVDPSSVTATSVRLYVSGSPTDVPVTRTVNGSTVTLTPTASLAGSTVYTVGVTTAVTDLVGNPLGSPDSWTFTTMTLTFTSTPAPTISGSALVGTTLTATLPPWTPAATSVSWQWYAGDAAIDGATESSFTLTSAQLGAVITVRATGHASGLTDQTRVSLPTAAVALLQVTAGTVTITGTPVVGGTLGVSLGTWTPTGVAFTYEWLRDGTTAIPTATATTYTPVAADQGHTLAVRVTGTKTGYASGTAVSAVTATVQQPTSAEQNRAFVARLYQDFLHRQASEDDITYWTNRLMSGEISRYQLATVVATSDEWISTVITGFYTDTLGRQPDAAGLKGWTDAARAGMPIAQIASAFYGSDEYFQNIGGNSNRTWVADLYVKLLHRAADPAGLEGWVRALENGMPRDTLAFGFYQSPETLQVRITTLYESLLDRAPESGAVANWSPFVRDHGDLVLAAALAASDEYFFKA